MPALPPGTTDVEMRLRKLEDKCNELARRLERMEDRLAQGIQWQLLARTSFPSAS
jgi:hypothetical protein